MLYDPENDCPVKILFEIHKQVPINRDLERDKIKLTGLDKPIG